MNGGFKVMPKTTLNVIAVNGTGNSEVHGASMVMENENIGQVPPPLMTLNDGVTLEVHDKFIQNSGTLAVYNGVYGNKVKLDTAEYDLSTGSVAIGNNALPDVFEVTGKMDWGDTNSTGLAKVVVGWDATTNGKCSTLQVDGNVVIEPYDFIHNLGAQIQYYESGSMPANQAHGGTNVTYLYTFVSIGGTLTGGGLENPNNQYNTQDQNLASDTLGNTDRTSIWTLTAKNW